MSATARLNFRLPPEIKEVIEEAAAQTGQSVTDFATATLVHAARQVLRDRDVTRLSARDSKRFVEMLDDQSAKPNKVLVAAAKRYKKRFRS